MLKGLTLQMVGFGISVYIFCFIFVYGLILYLYIFNFREGLHMRRVLICAFRVLKCAFVLPTKLDHPEVTTCS